MTRAAAALLAVALALAPLPLHGQDAATHHGRARELAQRERYAEAAEEFLKEHAAEGKPRALFNVAECYRSLYAQNGDTQALARAVRHYREYLAAEPAGPMAARARDLVAAGEAELRQKGGAPAPAPPPAPAPDLTVRGPAPAPAAPAPAAAPAAPFYKRWWFWTVIGVVAAGTATAIVVATRPEELQVPNLDFPIQTF